MSELRVTTLKHESATTDNITLDASGNTAMAGNLQAPNLYVTEATGNALRFSSDGYKYITAAPSTGDYLAIVQNPYAAGIQLGKSTVGATNTVVPLMQIDTAGRVTMPYQPAFRASSAASVDYTTGTTKITVYTGAVFNIGNHYNTSTQRFTAPVAGVYIFTARAWARQGNVTEAGIQFVKNGAASQGTLRIGSSRDGYSTLQPMVYVSLAVNDYVEVFTENCSSTGAIHTSAGDANSMFAGYLLG